MIEFFIPGPPVGKERPRLGKFGVYTPAKTQTYEAQIALLANVARNQAQIFAPLQNEVQIDLQIHCASKKAPDIDNIIKSILDGMNNVIYLDDSQVIALNAIKYLESTKPEGVHVQACEALRDSLFGTKPITCPDCHSTHLKKNGAAYKPPKRKYLCLNTECNRTSFDI